MKNTLTENQTITLVSENDTGRERIFTIKEILGPGPVVLLIGLLLMTVGFL